MLFIFTCFETKKKNIQIDLTSCPHKAIAFRSSCAAIVNLKKNETCKTHNELEFPSFQLVYLVMVITMNESTLQYSLCFPFCFYFYSFLLWTLTTAHLICSYSSQCTRKESGVRIDAAIDI